MSLLIKCIRFQEKLLEVIQNQLESCSCGFPAHVLNAEFPEAHHASTHILLFTSALVPKALASILTSFVLATGSKVSLLFVCMFSLGSQSYFRTKNI